MSAQELLAETGIDVCDTVANPVELSEESVCDMHDMLDYSIETRSNLK